MKASHIWRNCLIKELNIPDAWKNQDGKDCNPSRQDLFWVTCTKDETFAQLLNKIRDYAHLTRVGESITSYVAEYTFLITRNLSYIQYCPYFSLNSPGSLWEKFGETSFIQLSQLAHMERKDVD